MRKHLAAIGLASALTGLLALASPASAAPGDTTAGQPSGAPVVAATCEWVVTWPSAGVYEQPTRMYEPLKVKNAGDRVGGGYCMEHYNTSELEWYVSVSCSCASDGIGWMRRNALRAA
ncbi:glycosyltransferase [Micromonospora sagamiensis]|uniref:Uncharacterized protein n=1 Tax=Micromonospora sagamiensis TaxID=47875 RepID=A0A562W8D6_9ACTN|nr:glycosyltransferase [Micromonospora sagamiensis]TWJ26553.1 hypothetical protein JD81_00008 [Micromonospora sagamiensis]BCL14562.1 hypothetical protein GCM10017556_23010 [Micromonospora sagamiensis]